MHINYLQGSPALAGDSQISSSSSGISISGLRSVYLARMGGLVAVRSKIGSIFFFEVERC